MNKTVVLLAVSVLMLTGCGGIDSDLEAFVNETLAKPGGRLPEMPVFAPHETFAYSATQFRSPFQSPLAIEALKAQLAAQSDVEPDLTRERDILEGYAIGQLQMVGSIENDEKGFGVLISSSDGNVYRVWVGRYLGKDHGRVVALNEYQVDIVEIVPNGTGGWLERPRILTLVEAAK
jgi:type IV pilus assembly protein PilP